jgi:hypothetical protein
MDSPHSVCQPVRDWEPGDAGAAGATLLLDPTNGRLEAAPLPAYGATFAEYALSPRPRRADPHLVAPGSR